MQCTTTVTLTTSQNSISISLPLPASGVVRLTTTVFGPVIAVDPAKLESYVEGASFSAAMFFAEIEGHPEEPAVKRALGELDYFSHFVKVLGVYPADPFRKL